MQKNFLCVLLFFCIFIRSWNEKKSLWIPLRMRSHKREKGKVNETMFEFFVKNLDECCLEEGQRWKLSHRNFRQFDFILWEHHHEALRIRKKFIHFLVQCLFWDPWRCLKLDQRLNFHLNEKFLHQFYETILVKE